MAEKKQTEEEEFEINPDGADLDGTAEIERQQAGRTGAEGITRTTGPGER